MFCGCDSKTGELEELERSYAKLSVELEEQFSANRRRVTELQEAWEEQASAHQRRVEELQHENAASLRKLQDTAQQFEWLCEQQRHWICCVKRWAAMMGISILSLVLLGRHTEKTDRFKKDRHRKDKGKQQKGNIRRETGPNPSPCPTYHTITCTLNPISQVQGWPV